jgi:hypothetical protein
MRSALVRVTLLLSGMTLCIPPQTLAAQGQESHPVLPAIVAADPSSSALPDAPQPQITLAVLDEQSSPAQSQPPPSPPAATPGPSSANQQPGAAQDSSPASTPSNCAPNKSAAPCSPGSSSSSQSQQSQHQRAAEQIKQQEHQRILGILPSFNVSYANDAVSMTAGQKISLAFHSAIDPFPFGVAVLVAGYSEVREDNAGFGWGASGYFKRTGAAYLDEFNGTMIGNGFLPAVFHQDPRYFRLGHGSVGHRLLYAMATSYICKHDNSNRWEPNYSNVGGNILAGAISTLYYPSQHTGWDQTITDGFVVTTEGTVGGVLNEFWPDISRRLLHKDPTHGMDAQLAAADKLKKTAATNPPVISNDPLPIPAAPPTPAPAEKAF